MSDRMTSIKLPCRFGCSVADWGMKSIPEMLELIRSYAKQNKAEAEAILAATDDQFRVETYVGVHVMRNREIIQESTLTSAYRKGEP
jgi:hypothetical protein